MKRTIIFSIVILLLSGCVEIEKKRITSKQKAIKELKAEQLDKEIKYLEYLASKRPKSDNELTSELSKEQQEIMDNDKEFKFYSTTDLKFTIIKKLNITLSTKESVINGKYKLYYEGKKLGGDGIINFNVDYSNYSVDGEVIKIK